MYCANHHKELSMQGKSMFASWETFKATILTKTTAMGAALAAYGLYVLFYVGAASQSEQLIAISNVIIGLGMIAGRDAVRSTTAAKIAAITDLADKVKAGTLTQDEVEKAVETVTADDEASK